MNRFCLMGHPSRAKIIIEIRRAEDASVRRHKHVQSRPLGFRLTQRHPERLKLLNARHSTSFGRSVKGEGR